jgi:hypothetical protein
MTTDITARVARGAALLDEREPGWWQRIDLDRLDLRSPCRCVLGQLHGNYYPAADRMFGGDDRKVESAAIAHGFDSVGVIPPYTEYDALDAAWRDLITARRAEAAS